jgi:hypothetical protein
MVFLDDVLKTTVSEVNVVIGNIKEKAKLSLR